MRYRRLDANGDYSFGQGQANFLINSPAAVAQAVKTRLLLSTGEWFLDKDEGTPYATDVLGRNTQSKRDVAIRNRILGTPGVTGLASYTSSVDAAARKFSVVAVVDTEFGRTGPIPVTL